MEHENRIQPLTDLDVTVSGLLPSPTPTSSFLYALILAATVILSVLSVILFL